MWFTVSTCLYGLGAIWIMMTTMEEEGKTAPIVILSLFWPLYAMIMILTHFVQLPGGPSDDDDDDTPTGHT